MARHNIQFKGIRHTPSDITGQDGDLLECVNLVHENGELKPIEMPEKTALLAASGHSLVAVHNVVGEKIFVTVKVDSGNTILAAFKEGTPSQVTVNIGGSSAKTISGEVFKWADTIGNTLVVGTDKSTHYSLYKNGEYKWLGDKIPQPLFEFDFKRSADTDGGYYINEHEPNTYGLDSRGDTVTGGGIPFSGIVASGDEDDAAVLQNDTDENKKTIRDSILARVATAVNKAKNANVFVYPFFVRYAVRMYDGSHEMHSAPILMIPSTLKCPLLAFMMVDMQNNGGTWVTNVRTDGGGESYILCFDGVWFRGMELKLKFNGFVDGSASDWSDIVKGVDIFLSSQISTFDERQWDNLDNFKKDFYCFDREIDDGEGGLTPDPDIKDYGDMYSCNNKISWWDVYENNSAEAFAYDRLVTVMEGSTPRPSQYYGFYKIPLPSRNERAVFEEISGTHLFYKVKEYDLSDLSSSWSGYRFFTNEVTEKGILERLETLPTLPDDYVSRSRMAGNVSYNYNQRLLLGNLQMKAPLWYQDAKTFSSSIYAVTLTFEIEKADKTIYVSYDKTDSGGSGIGGYDFGHFIYYPDTDCKNVYVEIRAAVSGTLIARKKIPMKEHAGLNGAYVLMPDLQSLYESYASFSTVTSLPTQSTDLYYSLPNTIAMSSVANPFHFEATNFQDLGRTRVIGIATNTLDVSYNQWGPYSVIVFCADGIVTVPIDKKGDFTGEVEAISADVLREPQGYSQPTVVQTGQTLMFLTQRGVMMMSGTKIACVSDVLNGRHFNPLTDLSPTSPSASVLYGVGAFSSLISETSGSVDFKTFAASGFLAYDYAHNRALLLNNTKDYQYVFSLDTGLWSKQVSYTNLASIQIETVVNRDSALPTLTVVPMKAAVNNYTEMYLQDSSGYLYKTMDVANENASGSLYQYGYFVTRPVRFGTDEYKTITRMLHRYTGYAANSFAKVAVYGSRDGVKYGKLNTLRGMSWQYYIFVVYTYLKPNERYSYLSVDFETRMTNKLR